MVCAKCIDLDQSDDSGSSKNGQVKYNSKTAPRLPDILNTVLESR